MKQNPRPTDELPYRARGPAMGPLTEYGASEQRSDISVFEVAAQ